MDINILHLLDGAKKAEGFTVIIDVFRAFSVAPYLVSLGVKKIIPVGIIEEAYTLASSLENTILIGERNEKKPEGFLYGNSPSQIDKDLVSNKIVIHTTSSGTQGIVNATKAERIFTGSFVNANAIIKLIKKENPSKVSLCCMGYALQKETQEDTLCAEYIKAGLQDRFFDIQSAFNEIRNTSGKRFFIPENQKFSPESDFYFCLKTNIFDFVLEAVSENNYLVLKKIDAPNT